VSLRVHCDGLEKHRHRDKEGKVYSHRHNHTPRTSNLNSSNHHDPKEHPEDADKR
jgi:hypothetical protein